MIDRLGDLLASAWAQVTLAGMATANLIAAGMGLFAAEINDSVLTGAALFVMGTGTAIAGWALVLLVRLSNLVAGLEKTSDDHERRLGRLEGE